MFRAPLRLRNDAESPPPQVDRDHDGELGDHSGGGTKSRKRAREHGVVDEAAAARQRLLARQRAWLSRRHDSSAAHAWRPKALPRRSAYRWLLAVDNQLQVHTGGVGLAHFELPPEEQIASGSAPLPWTWPVLTVAADRGADGCAALHFLQRQKRVCVEEIFDASHDGWRDFGRMVRETGNLGYWYLYMVAVNVLQGPWLEASRFNAMTEAMQECWSHFNAQDCVLFDDLVARMQAEAGQNENIGSEEDKANLWRELQHDPVFAEKRYKVNSNRFWHSVEVGWTYSKNWTKFRFALTYLALENNSLSKATLEKFFFQPGAKTSTTAEATAAEERALKGKLSALACAVLFFSDYDRFYKLRMILSVAAPVEAWHRRQSHFCRSSTENAKWFEVQVAGFFSNTSTMFGAGIAWGGVKIALRFRTLPQAALSTSSGVASFCAPFEPLHFDESLSVALVVKALGAMGMASPQGSLCSRFLSLVE